MESGVKAILLVALFVFMVTLSSCSAIPDLAITPISADMQNGGTRETAVKEDNMIKVHTGSSSTVKYEAALVEQVYNDIQEYPMWLVLAFAFAVGMAIPSPIAAYGAWRQRKIMQNQIAFLSKLLAASKPDATVKLES